MRRKNMDWKENTVYICPKGGGGSDSTDLDMEEYSVKDQLTNTAIY